MRKTFILRAGAVAIALFALDQAAKLVARTTMPLCVDLASGCTRVRLGPLSLINVQNTGNMYLPDPAVAAAMGLVGAILVLVYAMWIRRVTPVAVLGAGLQAGGAASNVLDRLAFGGATDYLFLGRVIFNLSDLALLVGMVLAVATLARGLLLGDAAHRRTTTGSQSAT